jgi:hypothetical protein
MGDQILMKKIIFLTLLLGLQSYAGTDLKWVDEQIDAIKPARSGIKSSYINNLKDPIKLPVVLKSDTKTPGSPFKASASTDRKLHLRPLTVETIINKSAYINGHWYRVNQTVRGNKITSIKKNYVVLKDKKKQTRLFVNNKNDKIKITTR